jgi:hypothetical protein
MYYVNAMGKPSARKNGSEKDSGTPGIFAPHRTQTMIDHPFENRTKGEVITGFQVYQA